VGPKSGGVRGHPHRDGDICGGGLRAADPRRSVRRVAGGQRHRGRGGDAPRVVGPWVPAGPGGPRWGTAPTRRWLGLGIQTRQRGGKDPDRTLLATSPPRCDGCAPKWVCSEAGCFLRAPIWRVMPAIPLPKALVRRQLSATASERLLSLCQSIAGAPSATAAAGQAIVLALANALATATHRRSQDGHGSRRSP